MLDSLLSNCISTLANNETDECNIMSEKGYKSDGKVRGIVKQKKKDSIMSVQAV